jgi:hypothetical protein
VIPKTSPIYSIAPLKPGWKKHLLPKALLFSLLSAGLIVLARRFHWVGGVEKLLEIG